MVKLEKTESCGNNDYYSISYNLKALENLNSYHIELGSRGPFTHNVCKLEMELSIEQAKMLYDDIGRFLSNYENKPVE